MEIGADIILKATKVDGIYTSDPVKDHDAKKFPDITYIDVLKKGLKVMDSTAISLCMDNNLADNGFQPHEEREYQENIGRQKDRDNGDRRDSLCKKR